MLKRMFDVALAVVGGVTTSPLVLLLAILIWLQDRRSPFYIAPRVGRSGVVFRMVKFRTMIANADRLGGSSTASSDRRVTALGRMIRRGKLDEIPQLWNIAAGQMSFVGPRPQVLAEVEKYTAEERHLLDATPGLTDFSSIVFADEGEILKDATDPDVAYNAMIRPWKSRLGLFYVRNRTFAVDCALIALTFLAIAFRRSALRGTQRLLWYLSAPVDLVQVAARTNPLPIVSPPGA
jgi:lipopolysaccharide/colanic/teichoic acid biosynthesis glycosyltransferase